MGIYDCIHVNIVADGGKNDIILIFVLMGVCIGPFTIERCEFVYLLG